MAGALDGIRIIDMTAVILGPYGLQLLADQGADVIKVEPPEGEILRHIGPSKVNKGMGPSHLNINRNKRSLALDLKQPKARAALMKLIGTADALIHSMRPQAMAGLGLDYDSVRAVKPDIVYVGAYGFSQRGPYADLPAYDDVIQAMSGVAALEGMRDGIPKYAPTIIADKTCGLTLAYAALVALMHKERSGQGQKVEVPMFETMAQYLMVEHLYLRTFDQKAPAGYDRMMAPGRKPYRTKDGWVSILPYTDRHWRRFFEIAGRDDLAKDTRFVDVVTRSKNIVALYDTMEGIVALRTTGEWLALMKKAEIPSAAINSLDDLFADPHLREVGLFAQAKHPSEGEITVVNPPLGFSATPSAIHRMAPLIGQHSRELLGEAGLSSADIDALVASGAAVEPKAKKKI